MAPSALRIAGAATGTSPANTLCAREGGGPVPEERI